MHTYRTDLAAEAHAAASQHGELDGVKLSRSEGSGYKLTSIDILNQSAAEKLNKPIGKYITLDTTENNQRDPKYRECLAVVLSAEIEKLVMQQNGTVLVIGLGNHSITSDALGPEVVKRMLVTRHIIELMPDEIDKRLKKVAAISTGVLGVTGIETIEVVKGLVERIKPTCVIVIDALASRNVGRICRSIQISDGGIEPGSGVNNKRMALSKDTLGVDVIAVGVPTVVYAKTIGHEALESFYSIDGEDNEMPYEDFAKTVDSVLTDRFNDLVVTPKDIDIWIEDVSQIIADALNLALHDGLTMDEIKHYLN